jgi:hypothetical protein
VETPRTGPGKAAARPRAPQATSCRTRSRRSQQAASAASAIATAAKAPLNFVPVATPASADATANRSQLGRWYAQTAAVTVAVIQKVSVTSVTAKWPGGRAGPPVTTPRPRSPGTNGPGGGGEGR